MRKIALISCSAKKREGRHRAIDLYSPSSLFRLSVAYAKKILGIPEKDIYILSAKYGLVPAFKEIESYNETLNNKSKKERQQWAEKVLKQIKKNFDISQTYFYIIAGENYYEFLIPQLPNHEIILEGLPIGKKLKALNEALNEKKN
jgi:cytoplasmic iron level regulating protein YaaA (DUF328/UPF0246 family)